MNLRINDNSAYIAIILDNRDKFNILYILLISISYMLESYRKRAELIMLIFLVW